MTIREIETEIEFLEALVAKLDDDDPMIDELEDEIDALADLHEILTRAKAA